MTMKAITPAVRDGGLHWTRVPRGLSGTRILGPWDWACRAAGFGPAVDVPGDAGDVHGLITTPSTSPAVSATDPAPSRSTSQVRRGRFPVARSGSGAVPGVAGRTGGKSATRRSFLEPSVSPARRARPGESTMAGSLPRGDAWPLTRSPVTGARTRPH